MPIGKLVFNMSLPMMVSMLVQALYNIVDSIFVAKLSENAPLVAIRLARFWFFSPKDLETRAFIPTPVRPFYTSQTGNADQEIMTMGIEYLSTVMIFSFGLFTQFFFERLLTSTGKTIFSMTSHFRCTA